MQSYIISGSTDEERIKKFEEISKSKIVFLINSPDFHLIAPFEKDSISIDQIRGLQRKISLKPFFENKIIILIRNAETMTVEAQNSLLKTLEEPPDYCLFFLLCSQPNFLPTITSRCQMILIKNNEEILNSDENCVNFNFIKSILSFPPGKRLSVLDNQEIVKIKKETNSRQQAEKWLNDVQTGTRKRILEKIISTQSDTPDIPLSQLLDILKKTGLSKKYLSANCNIKLVIENLILSL